MLQRKADSFPSSLKSACLSTEMVGILGYRATKTSGDTQMNMCLNRCEAIQIRALPQRNPPSEDQTHSGTAHGILSRTNVPPRVAPRFDHRSPAPTSPNHTKSILRELYIAELTASQNLCFECSNSDPASYPFSRAFDPVLRWVPPSHQKDLPYLRCLELVFRLQRTATCLGNLESLLSLELGYSTWLLRCIS